MGTTRRVGVNSGKRQTGPGSPISDTSLDANVRHVHTHVYAHVYAHVHTQVDRDVCIHVCTNICTSIYKDIDMQIYADVDVSVHAAGLWSRGQCQNDGPSW